MPKKMRRSFRTWLLPCFAVLALSNAAIGGELEVVETKNGGDIELRAKSPNNLDVTLTLVGKLQNMTCSPGLPLTIDSGGKPEFLVARFHPIDPDIQTHYFYLYYWKPGLRVHSMKENSYRYSLPFQGEFKEIEGFGAKVSEHFGAQDENAIGWEMPIGTEVFAARDGIVVGIKQDSEEGDEASGRNYSGNYLVIRHNDDTYAEYRHLDTNSVKVKLGQTVKAGEAIARSGATGFRYGFGPHLHFTVYCVIDGLSRITLKPIFTSQSDRK